MRLYTIGFTKKSADAFFSAIRGSGANRVIDVRLNNVSQLAGFSKRDDLAYFLREICGIDYEHLPILAPTQELLDAYRKQQQGWPAYERAFIDLMKQRRVESSLARALVDGSCLLCSEDQPEHCHRRLVAEYLRDAWGDVEIVHLA